MGELSGPEHDFDMVRPMCYYYMRERKTQVRHIWLQNAGKYIELAVFILSYNNCTGDETVVFLLSYYTSECDEPAVFVLSHYKSKRVESAVFVLSRHTHCCVKLALWGSRML